MPVEQFAYGLMLGLVSIIMSLAATSLVPLPEGKDGKTKKWYREGTFLLSFILVLAVLYAAGPR